MGGKTLLIIPEPLTVDNQSSYENRHKSWFSEIDEQKKIDLIFAYNAIEARILLEKINIDAILFGLGQSPKDWYNEGKHECHPHTGFRVLEEIRGNPKYATTPIVIRTCMATKGGLEPQLQKLGIEDFLVEPVLTCDLYEAVVKYLSPTVLTQV